MPDGSVRVLGDELLAFSDTSSPGVYRVTYRDQSGAATGGVIAARQFASAEAAGSSRTILTTDDGTGASAESTLLREWAPAILAALLTVVLLEWWVAYGRPLPRRRNVAT